jgi:predicted RNA-binding protein (virulence factor B family)
MIKMGDYNNLQVIDEVDFGIYLGPQGSLGLPEEKVLLPKKHVPEGTQIGDMLEVFIYRDSSDRVIATTLTPKAKVGEFAYLEVKQVNDQGAFLDWGLEKDLFVPFREQKIKMVEGSGYVVWLYVDDKTGRITATSRIGSYFNLKPIDVKPADEVDLLVYKILDIGASVIVNNSFQGLIYKSDIYHDLFVGDRLKGYVLKVRDDDKLDVTIRKPGFSKVLDSKEQIIEKLKASDGFLFLHDKSSADEIYHVLHMSKRSFKEAIGMLYKEKVIDLMDTGIRLRHMDEGKDE